VTYALLALNNGPAAFTAIADIPALRENYFFEIPPAYLVDRKAFRTAVSTQLALCNDKMAVPASNFTVRVGHQPQYFVFAEVHSECGA
jgi:hypothetical protein